MWKAFNDKYEVSSLGYVRNIKTGRILKTDINSKGYLRVMISRKHYFVHKLVGLLYVDNPLNLPQLNHINAIKTNNDRSNLEWCTNIYNTKQAYLNGRMSGRTKLSIEALKDIRTNTSSVKDIAKLYNVAPSTIYAVRQGRNINRLGEC